MFGIARLNTLAKADSGPTYTWTFVASRSSTSTAAIALPLGSAAGDVCVLMSHRTSTGAAAPTGWTGILSNSAFGGGTNSEFVSATILTPAMISTGTVSYTGSTSSIVSKLLVTFRPSGGTFTTLNAGTFGTNSSSAATSYLGGAVSVTGASLPALFLAPCSRSVAGAPSSFSFSDGTSTIVSAASLRNHLGYKMIESGSLTGFSTNTISFSSSGQGVFSRGVIWLT